MEDFCKQEDKKRKEQALYIKVHFEYIKEVYPKFYKQLLLQFYSTSNGIVKGTDLNTIRQKEQQLSLTFPDDLIQFFLNITHLELEGIQIDLEEMYSTTFNNEPFLVLGEYWCYGDGDLLLYDTKTSSVLVYAHEYTPPKIIRLANSITELLEKEFVKYLKSI